MALDLVWGMGYGTGAAGIGMIRYGPGQYSTVWCGMVWYGMEWYGIELLETRTSPSVPECH